MLEEHMKPLTDMRKVFILYHVKIHIHTYVYIDVYMYVLFFVIKFYYSVLFITHIKEWKERKIATNS